MTVKELKKELEKCADGMVVSMMPTLNAGDDRDIISVGIELSMGGGRKVILSGVD